jgi:hypothetical protein
MPKLPEKGIPAKYKYQTVKYCHFEVDPGISLLLTADPWFFLDAWLLQCIKRTKGDKKRCLQRAAYYAELAEGFYRAAEPIDLPIKGTLLYYGMLNLVKCYLSSHGKELETKWEHHGLTVGGTNHDEVTIISPSRNPSQVNIFHEFARTLGTPVKNRQSIALKDIWSHIPDIHEIAFMLGHLPAKKRALLPVEIEFLVNERKDRLFTEIRYNKKNEARMSINRFHAGYREKYFKQRGERDGWVIFRSIKRKKLSGTNWKALYANIQKEYKKFDLVSLLTKDGYRYYCDLNPGQYHHLCCSLLLMYYIGTIARYRPTKTKEIMVSDYLPLLTEAVETCHVQFLYQLVSLITKNICVVPHAKLY